jgi:hypothetical protein
MNEDAIFNYTVNLSTQGVAVGGHLLFTNTYFEFRPNGLNSTLASANINAKVEPFQIPYVDILEVTIKKRSFSFKLDGSIRNRLRITTSKGNEFLFVINKLDKRLIEINNLIRR